jgi:hypothetical protein
MGNCHPSHVEGENNHDVTFLGFFPILRNPLMVICSPSIACLDVMDFSLETLEFLPMYIDLFVVRVNPPSTILLSSTSKKIEITTDSWRTEETLTSSPYWVSQFHPHQPTLPSLKKQNLRTPLIGGKSFRDPKVLERIRV